MKRIITGTGSFLPGPPIGNAELGQRFENFDPRRAGCDLDTWLRRHFGVSTRHLAGEGVSTGDLALGAGRRALEAAQLEASELDLIVMSTATSDHVAPHSVSHLQSELGCRAVFHQLQDACAGFLNALMVADSLMANLGYRRALVVSAEKMSHLVDPRDFRLGGLFGDGSGAAILESLEAPKGYGFLSFYAGSDGAAGRHLRVPAGGSRRPLTADRIAAGEQYLVSDFEQVFAFAVQTTARCVREASSRAGLEPDELNWVIPHHAGANVVELGLAEVGVPLERALLCIDHAGNTSSASVPIALDEAARRGTFEDGDRVLLLGLGAGLAWGSTVYAWLPPERARGLRRT